MDYIEAQLISFPDRASDFNELATLFKDKLWFQMASKLLQVAQNPFFQDGQHLVQMYERFVQKFASKLNQVALVQFAVAVADQYPDVASSITFLESLAKAVSGDAQASLLVQTDLCRRTVLGGQLDNAKSLLEKSKQSIDAHPGAVDDVVHSGYYLAALEFHKVKGPAADFFRNALLYLQYTPVERIPRGRQVVLASDIGLAALLSHNIYNFGEFLQHPIVQVLKGTEFEWLGELLFAFNKGDIQAYNRVFEAVHSKHPVLRTNAAFLSQKVRILAFLDAVFKRPSADRTFEFKDIAAACDLKQSEVELLVMKAFSLQIARGQIDQVEGTVRVSWIQPRMLDVGQMSALRERVKGLGATVQETTTFMLANAKELIPPTL